MTESDLEIKQKLEVLDYELKDLRKFKNKLIDCYLLEFEENFSDLIILDKGKYLDRFGEKISLILSDKYSERAYDRDEFINLLNNVEDIFLNKYYEVSLAFLKTQVKSINEGSINSENDSYPLPCLKMNNIKRSSSDNLNKSKRTYY